MREFSPLVSLSYDCDILLVAAVVLVFGQLVIWAGCGGLLFVLAEHLDIPVITSILHGNTCSNDSALPCTGQ